MKFAGAYIAPSMYLNLLVALKRTKFKPMSVDLADLCQKFDHSGYEKILVTYEFAELLLKNRVLSGAQICIAITAKQYATLEKNLIQDFKNKGTTWLVNAQDAQSILTLSEDESVEEILYFLDKKMGLPAGLNPSRLSKLRLLCPYETKKEAFDKCLEFFEKDSFQARSSRYMELWPLEEMTLWFEPDYTVLQDLRKGDATYANSVVVPFQDNPHELKTMLKSLVLSLSPSENAEILIVDDSFESKHTEEILSELRAFAVPSVYIKMQRPQARKRGDASFRAGVTRNVRALLSRGQELIFVDSDILVGKSLWEELTRVRENHEGPVMPRRHFLLAGNGLEQKNYTELHPGQDTHISWGGHWEDFYREPAAEKEVWKWTSTYCLAIPKIQFMKLGGFQRSFYCYGFEDTDLGYKLAKNGYSLKVLNSDVFHLPLSQERSEFGQDSRRRKELLKKSFEVFMRNSLDYRLRKLFHHVLE